jgi:hypothetical protein
VAGTTFQHCQFAIFYFYFEQKKTNKIPSKENLEQMLKFFKPESSVQALLESLFYPKVVLISFLDGNKIYQKR